jgi:uncharacterized membrane protein
VIRVAPDPQRVIIGTFFVLAAVVCAVAPVPVLFRSLGVVLFAYLSFGIAGMPFAYLTALLAPPIGLFGGSSDWLVMLPIVMSGNLLAMLALEYGWRYPALLLSPALLVTPALFVQAMTRRELFAVELPWDGGHGAWLTLHVLVALLGILASFVLDRRRGRQATARAAGAPGDTRPPVRPAPTGDAGRGRRT